MASATRTGSGTAPASTQPTALLSSSMSPIATMRGASFGTRAPSPRPVVPSSPVRVTILLSLWPMASDCSENGVGLLFGNTTTASGA